VRATTGSNLHQTPAPRVMIAQTLEAQLQKFPVDLWGSPVRILSRHAANKSPNLLAHLGSAAARPRSPAPIQVKTRPCHPTTVSGFTMTRTPDHRGHRHRSVVQKRRSRWFSESRGRFRLSTATCCCRARTSSEILTRLRKKTRMAARNAVIKWGTSQPL
jgi:hypothetical protein